MKQPLMPPLSDSQKSSSKTRRQSASIDGFDAGSSKTARLRILDKEVQLSCKPGEEDDLMQAAAYVDKSMRDLRRKSATSSLEKIAIVTAINTAHALLKSRLQESEDDPVLQRVAAINSKLDKLLSDSTKVEKAEADSNA